MTRDVLTPTLLNPSQWTCRPSPVNPLPIKEREKDWLSNLSAFTVVPGIITPMTAHCVTKKKKRRRYRMNSLLKVLILLTALVHLANTETTTKDVLVTMAKCLFRHNLSNYGVVGHDGHFFVVLVPNETDQKNYIVTTSLTRCYKESGMNFHLSGLFGISHIDELHNATHIDDVAEGWVDLSPFVTVPDWY